MRRTSVLASTLVVREQKNAPPRTTSGSPASLRAQSQSNGCIACARHSSEPEDALRVALNPLHKLGQNANPRALHASGVLGLRVMCGLMNASNSKS